MSWIATLLYNLLFPVAFLAYSPFYLVRQFRRGGMDAGFLERFAWFSQEKKAALAALRQPVWIHAVSVGETVAALGFANAWRQRHPGLEFVISTTTTTGQEIARKKAPPGTVVIYCPLDWWPLVRRTAALVRPRLLVVFEVELWPNLISVAAGRCPVALANGRMSDRSAGRYARFAAVFRPLLAKFSLLCVQDDKDQQRFLRVAGEQAPVHACSTMKFDQVSDVAAADLHAVLDTAFGPAPRRCWVAGSTHPGEETLALQVFRKLKAEFPDLRLILVPRHVERTAEVERLLRQEGISYRLLKGDPAAGATPAEVLLVNTTGQLMAFYGAADFAYVGKSLAGNTGGHNIIEPAIFGKPIVHGAAMQNFRMVAELFRDAKAAVEVVDADGLEQTLRQWLAHPETAADYARRSRQLVEHHRGAMGRTIDLLEPLL